MSYSLFAPRGTAALGDTIYVADTGNHRLRAIQRDSGQVVTVAGTGERGLRLAAGAEARTTALASPWDVLAHGGQIYVAFAGTHQLARYDPATERIEPVAGSGGEGLTDGPGNLAMLAQPSGLATDGESLFFADAESSSIRKLGFANLGGRDDRRQRAFRLGRCRRTAGRSSPPARSGRRIGGRCAVGRRHVQLEAETDRLDQRRSDDHRRRRDDLLTMPPCSAAVP